MLPENGDFTDQQSVSPEYFLICNHTEEMSEDRQDMILSSSQYCSSYNRIRDRQPVVAICYYANSAMAHKWFVVN